MTAQEVFETVARHLFEQGEQSIEAGECVYRGPHGLKCAVGRLIPDEAYSGWMEGKPASVIVGCYGGLAHLRKHAVLLNLLQSVHDEGSHWSSTAAMREALCHVASQSEEPCNGPKLDTRFLSTLRFKCQRRKS